jgi:hypothetical protein
MPVRIYAHARLFRGVGELLRPELGRDEPPEEPLLFGLLLWRSPGRLSGLIVAEQLRDALRAVGGNRSLRLDGKWEVT